MCTLMGLVLDSSSLSLSLSFSLSFVFATMNVPCKDRFVSNYLKGALILDDLMSQNHRW